MAGRRVVGRRPSEPEGASPVGLDTMTRSVASAANYHAWLFDQLRDFVGTHVLEIGAGSGNLTQHLIGMARVTALDLSSEALDVLAERIGPSDALQTIVGNILDPAVAQRLATADFDTVVSSNVLEHIEDDARAIASMRTILAPTAGHALLLVPAHSWLFGTLDEAAGHHRRYSRAVLTRLFADAGFRVIRAHYLNLMGAVAWYLNGSILRTRDLNATSVNRQAWLFDRLVVPALRRIEGTVKPPFGQSLVLIARAT